jgi:hypothetical protein
MLRGAMTDQQKPRRDIDTLRALIQFDLGELDSKLLSADQRRLIKDHHDGLISELQMLLRTSRPAELKARQASIWLFVF